MPVKKTLSLLGTISPIRPDLPLRRDLAAPLIRYRRSRACSNTLCRVSALTYPLPLSALEAAAMLTLAASATCRRVTVCLRGICKVHYSHCLCMLNTLSTRSGDLKGRDEEAFSLRISIPFG